MSAQFYNLAEIPDYTADKKLKILFLADNRHQANVVRDHINGLLQHSDYKIHVVNPIHEKPPIALYFGRYDAVIIHYSIFVLSEYYLPPNWVGVLKRFTGTKAQIIQDEHRYIDAMKWQMQNIGIDMVFSSLTKENLSKVYAGNSASKLCFYSCIPGYISDSYFNYDSIPIANRPLDIVYRGRTLPAYLGRHAREKMLIGERIQNIAEEFDLKVDISSEETTRIYGHDWIRFLMSGRATLGVEGGASIFDFSGDIIENVNAYLESYPDAEFDELWDRFLAPYEGNVTHKTITPKIFEAIATKTALVLYTGQYRGVLEPGRHYIELKEDFSDLVEVLNLVKDTEYLQKMVDITYSEILYRPELSEYYYASKVWAAISAHAS